MKKILIFLFFIPYLCNAYTLEEIMGMTPKDGLFYALEYYEIKEPYIVYSQAILETGNFTSKLCVEHGNLFGIYDSINYRYKHFSHWIKSVEAYKRRIQNRYKEGEDYYRFLLRINYASDPDYISKLKRINKELTKYD